MKILHLFLSLFAFSFLLLGQESKPLSLDILFNSSIFDLATLDEVKWPQDGMSFTFVKKEAGSKTKSFYRHDLNTGKESLILDGSKIKDPNTGSPLKIDSYKFIADDSKILFEANQQKIWRHSTRAQFFIYDINKKELSSLIDGDPLVSNAKISPDGSKVGFVRKNNIFVFDITTSTTNQLTKDGSENILNGIFDWVYEEEFSIWDGWQWSPDGQKIAFWKFDQSRVPEFSWIDYMPLNGAVNTIRYPKAGQANSKVKIAIIDLKTDQTTFVDLGDDDDIYIPRMNWIDDESIAVQRLNRLQNKLDFLTADVNSGESRIVFSETDTAWVDIHDNLIFFGKQNFIWTSERDGFNHIYIGDLINGTFKQITIGNWEVQDVYGIADGYVYFRANKEGLNGSWIYSVRTDGSDLNKLTKQNGQHKANFSGNFKWFTNTYSAKDTPIRYELRKNDGTLVRTLIANEIVALNQYEIIVPEFGEFKTSDNVSLPFLLYKPKDFDPQKKYPVLIYGYGGPGSQIVLNNWGTGGTSSYSQKRHLWHGMLAEKGYLVFTMDNRGTGGRGKEFKNLAYKDISKFALKDHVEGVKYLKSLPYVDPDRIGIWGWSGGGYLTLHALFRAAEHFKLGISVAPLVDPRLYDTIWTERYMNLPGNNPDGYKAASASTYSDGLKGKLLIIHGTADDNVHFQNVMQLAHKMQQESPRQFDLMVYPGLNHRLNGGKSFIHLHELMTNYILENL